MRLYRLNESDSSREDAVINQFMKAYRSQRIDAYSGKTYTDYYPITDLKLTESSYSRKSSNSWYEFIVLTDTSDIVAARSYLFDGKKIYQHGFFEATITTIDDMNGNEIEGTLIKHNLYDSQRKTYRGNFYEGKSAFKSIRTKILSTYNNANDIDALKVSDKAIDMNDDDSLVAHYNYDVTGLDITYNPEYSGNIPEDLTDTINALDRISNKGIWGKYVVKAKKNGYSHRDPYTITLHTNRLKVLDDNQSPCTVSLTITITPSSTVIDSVYTLRDLMNDLSDELSARSTYDDRIIINRPLVMRDFKIIDKVIKNHEA